MSGKSNSGGGAGILEYFTTVYRDFNPPYLRRNLNLVISHLNALRPPTMGSAASALLSPSRQTLEEDEEESEEDVRPAKRQRTRMFQGNESAPPKNESVQRQLFGQVTRPKIPASKGVNPAEFYGKPRLQARDTTSLSRRASSTKGKASSKTGEKILPQDPWAFIPALRIDLFGISPIREDSWVPSTGKPRKVEIKCRCAVTVSCATNDSDLEQQDWFEVSRKVQIGVLRVTFNGDNVIRECKFTEPYIFLSHEIMVNRKTRKQSAPGSRDGDSERYFGVGDAYSFQVHLEPIGYQREWPSLDVFSSLYYPQDPPAEALAKERLTVENPPLHDLQLTCRFDTNFQHSPGPKYANLQISSNAYKHMISYEMRADIKWSLPNRPRTSIPSRHIKFDPTLNLPSTATQVVLTSLDKRDKTTDMDDLPESPGDGRAQRRRNNVATYNLKTLSAQAQGKSPRVRKMEDLSSDRRESTQEISERAVSELRQPHAVTYVLGADGLSGHTVRQQTVVESLTCPFCLYHHRRLNELRLHLRTNHSNFKFRYGSVNGIGVTFFVDAPEDNLTGGDYELARTFQLGKPKSIFDFEKYLDGEDSWIRAREGPLHNLFPKHLDHLQHILRPVESSSSASPRGSRHSSPNTSNGPDEMDIDNPEPELLKPERPRKIILVPKTRGQLFDGVTKRFLQPGEEVPDSNEEANENWLHHKQRDVIMDYEDVTDDEKDYLIKWNAFIMEERLTCEKFLPESCIKFARVFATEGWFAQRKSRKREFSIHLETFVMRGVLEESHFKQCIRIVKKSVDVEKARRKEDVNMAEADEALSLPKQRGTLDCACGELTQPTDRVVCRGMKCPGRVFHRGCAQKQGRPITGLWRCDACISKWAMVP